MVKLYLDNNIIARLEEGKFTQADIYKIVGSEKIEIHYSDDHLREAHPLRYTHKELGLKRVLNRLKFISDLTNNRFLGFDKQENIVSVSSLPFFRYVGIKDYPTEDMVKAGFQDNMPNAMRALYRTIFNFQPQELNDIPVDKIIDVLSQKYSERLKKNNGDLKEKWGTSLKELEQEYFRQMGGNPSTYQKIAAIFLLLDLCGYWKDKETDRSDFARMYDSSHATMATYCDFFISNDKKTRMKTQVAYHYLNTCYNAGIKTQVIELTK